MKDDTLLKLEKKLENYSTKDILLSKFIIKPDIDKNELARGKDFLKNIDDFVNVFKQQNNQILNDENKIKELNIENGAKLGKNGIKRKLRRLGNNTTKNKKINNEDKFKFENGNSNFFNSVSDEGKHNKFIELNLKLGILDIIKKENKPKIEEIITNEIEQNPNNNENYETRSNKDIPILRVKLNKKSKDDEIFNTILKNKPKENGGSENIDLENYPFLDLKNDNLNKEIMNFLIENSKNTKKSKKIKSKIKKDK